MKNTKSVMASVAMSLALSACASQWQGLNTWQPKTDPLRPTTPFTAALACIKGELRDSGAPPVTITVGNIPDATGRIMPGMRDMVTSALSDVTMGSRAFKLTEIGSYGLLIGPTFGAKQDIAGTMLGISGVKVGGGFQLVGALTQADNANSDIGLSGGASLYQNQRPTANNTIDLGLTNTTSTVALDLRLIDISNGLAVAYSTRSMLRVQTSGVSANVNFSIGDVGANLGYNSTISEGAHQAVRELVELSVAELLGQAAHVPYWSCLGANRADPKIQAMIQGWYTRMSDSQTDLDMRARLRTAGYVVPEPPNSASPAILQYQHANGLVPTGKPSFETFASLVERQLPPDRAIEGLPDVSAPMVNPGAAPAPAAPMAMTPAPMPAPVKAAPAAPAASAPIPAPVPAEAVDGKKPAWCATGRPAAGADRTTYDYYCH